MNCQTTVEIEVAIAKYFGVRQNTIVPGVSWGLGIHECDMLVVSRSGYMTEVEIKVSRSDLKKDLEKRHGHKNARIKALYFAVPEKLGIDFALEYIPERSGLIVVGPGGRCNVHKDPVVNNRTNPLSESELLHLARLGTMRIWSLKERIIMLKNQLSELRASVKADSKTIL